MAFRYSILDEGSFSTPLTKGKDVFFLLEALDNAIPSLPERLEAFAVRIKDVSLLLPLSPRQITCMRDTLPVCT